MLKMLALAICLFSPFAARAELACPDPRTILVLSHEFEILKTSPQVNSEMCGGGSLLVTLAKSLGNEQAATALPAIAARLSPEEKARADAMLKPAPKKS